MAETLWCSTSQCFKGAWRALIAELGSLQCKAWQEDFCPSAFLLHVGKKQNLLGCVCRNSLLWPVEQQEGGRSWRRDVEWRGLLYGVLVFTLDKFFPAAVASESDSSQWAAGARLLTPISPSICWAGERASVWPWGSPQQEGAWGGSWFFHVKTSQAVKRESYGHK